MEKRIELIPLAEIGSGFAILTENSVQIEVNGINGGLKAWLIGGEAVPIGNIVNGKLSKNISTKGHIGILITQSGRQMLIGKFEKERSEEITEIKETVPFNVSGFSWRKITEKSFSEVSREIRFIISNKSVYDNFKKYGHYWVGEGETSGALALKCDGKYDPLDFLGKIKLKENGYVIACIDKKTNKLYIPEKR